MLSAGNNCIWFAPSCAAAFLTYAKITTVVAGLFIKSALALHSSCFFRVGVAEICGFKLPWNFKSKITLQDFYVAKNNCYALIKRAGVVCDGVALSIVVD